MLPLLLVLAAGPAGADDFWMTVRITYDAGRTVDTTVGWRGRRKVVDLPTHRWIIDLDRNVMTLLDKRARTRRDASLDQVRLEVDGGALEIRRRLRGIGRGSRGVLEAMGATPNWRFSLRPLGRHEVIAGVRATAYTIERGPIRGEIWVSRQLVRPPDATEWERLTAHVGGLVTAGTKLAAAVARLGGVVVRTRLRMQQQPEVLTEAVEIRLEAPAEELFTVPPDVAAAAHEAPAR